MLVKGKAIDFITRYSLVLRGGLSQWKAWFSEMGLEPHALVAPRPVQLRLGSLLLVSERWFPFNPNEPEGTLGDLSLGPPPPPAPARNPH